MWCFFLPWNLFDSIGLHIKWAHWLSRRLWLWSTCVNTWMMDKKPRNMFSLFVCVQWISICPGSANSIEFSSHYHTLVRFGRRLSILNYIFSFLFFFNWSRIDVFIIYAINIQFHLRCVRWIARNGVMMFVEKHDFLENYAFMSEIIWNDNACNRIRRVHRTFPSFIFLRSLFFSLPLVRPYRMNDWTFYNIKDRKKNTRRIYQFE